MKVKIKETFKYSKLSIIMCIITLLIGIWFYSSTAIGIPIKEKLIIFLASFIPFFIFLIITILSYHFKERYKKIFTIISIILGLPLGYYMVDYIFKVAVSDKYDFNANIKPMSYIYAIVGTFIVSYIVSKFLSRKVKKIDMVSSLKGNE